MCVRGPARTSIAAVEQHSGPCAAANMPGMLLSSSASSSRASDSLASRLLDMGAYTSDTSAMTSI